MSADEPEILRLITRLNIGGPARQALDLTRRITRPTLLVAGRPRDDEGELRDERVSVHRVRLVRPVSPGDDIAALREVRALLTRHPVRLVHTHMAKAGTIGRTAAHLVRRQPKLVHTFHGHVLEGYFSSATQRAFVAAERVLARRTDALVAVSPQVRDDLLALGIGDEGRWHVIPLGFDLAAFHAVTGPTGALRARMGVPDGTPVVAVVGRLVPIKDHDTMLAAAARLDPAVHVAIVGDGERRAELEAEAARLGVTDRVHFLGWWLDMATVLADADLVVLTSRNEGTPVSLIEAAAAARASVATDVGGVASVVEDGATGLLVPPGDPTAVAEAITALLGDDDRRAAMGATARATVAPRFTLDRLVRDVSALYDRLLD